MIPRFYSNKSPHNSRIDSIYLRNPDIRMQKVCKCDDNLHKEYTKCSVISQQNLIHNYLCCKYDQTLEEELCPLYSNIIYDTSIQVLCL